MLSTGWGLLILGILILRVRNVLHTGLLEAALERSARDGGIGSSGELQFCLRCEMPLLDNASFCTACGTAVRAQAKPHKARRPCRRRRLRIRDRVPAGSAPGRVVHRDDQPDRWEATSASAPSNPPGSTSSRPANPGSDPDAGNRFYDDEEGRA